MIEKQVELKLGEKTYILAPTLDAMIKINRGLGSAVDAMARVRKADFEAICLVIAAGAGVGPKQANQLQQEVFEAGVLNQTAAVSEYLVLLLNPTGEEADDSGKE